MVKPKGGEIVGLQKRLPAKPEEAPKKPAASAVKGGRKAENDERGERDGGGRGGEREMKKANVGGVMKPGKGMKTKAEKVCVCVCEGGEVRESWNFQ